MADPNSVKRAVKPAHGDVEYWYIKQYAVRLVIRTTSPIATETEKINSMANETNRCASSELGKMSTCLSQNLYQHNGHFLPFHSLFYRPFTTELSPNPPFPPLLSSAMPETRGPPPVSCTRPATEQPHPPRKTPHTRAQPRNGPAVSATTACRA